MGENFINKAFQFVICLNLENNYKNWLFNPEKKLIEDKTNIFIEDCADYLLLVDETILRKLKKSNLSKMILEVLAFSLLMFECVLKFVH